MIQKTTELGIQKFIPLLSERSVVREINIKRAEKIIGSSLEASIKIKLEKELYELAKNFDFAELCITSEAEIEIAKNLDEEILVETIKAEGKKCKICWKIRKGKCERHG